MGLFIDDFTLFPWSLFGLAVPDMSAWLEVQSSHICIYTVKSIITKHGKGATIKHTSLITLFNSTHEGQSDSVPNISVWKSLLHLKLFRIFRKLLKATRVHTNIFRILVSLLPYLTHF